jgi:hypothetical protein
MERALADPMLGAKVVLRGVRAKRELEGKVGVVTASLSGGERHYVVRLDAGRGTFTVQASHLERLDDDDVASAPSNRRELSGGLGGYLGGGLGGGLGDSLGGGLGGGLRGGLGGGGLGGARFNDDGATTTTGTSLLESSLARFSLVFNPIPTLFNGLRTAATSPGSSQSRPPGTTI